MSEPYEVEVKAPAHDALRLVHRPQVRWKQWGIEERRCSTARGQMIRCCEPWQWFHTRKGAIRSMHRQRDLWLRINARKTYEPAP